MPRVVHSDTIATTALAPRFGRGDIEFHGLDHSGPSYEGRVYLNNTAADDATSKAADTGYAGSYYVFGHGRCVGDAGHCDVHTRPRYDPRPPHPLTPTRLTVIATDAIKRAVKAGGEVTVTVVPVINPSDEYADRPDDVVRYETVRFVTYD